MAIKVSGKGLNLKSKVIDKRKGVIDNPVENLLDSCSIKVRRRDKDKLDIKRYLSREDITLMQRLSPVQKKQLLYKFSNSKEYKELEKVLENIKPEDNFIESNIRLSKSVKLEEKIQYYDEEIHSGKKNITESGQNYTSQALKQTEVYDNVDDVDVNISKAAGNKNKKKRKTKIRLSEDNNSTNRNENTASENTEGKNQSNKTNNEASGSHQSTYHSNSETENRASQTMNGKEAEATKEAASGTAETAANTGAAASSAGTSEVVKIAEKAVKKYTDTIKQAVDQNESERTSLTSGSDEAGETITTKASAVMSKLTTTVITMSAFTVSYIAASCQMFIMIIIGAVLMAVLVISVISSVAGVITNTVNKAANGIRMYLLSENTISYVDDMREAADYNDILNYVNYLMAIMEIESHGNGNDPMQSSESAGLPPDSFDNPKDSINQGVYYFACCISKANDEGCDLMSAVQAYNYGTGFIDYVADNGGQYTLDLAISFAEEYSGGMQVDYSNPIAVDYNGGWRYAYGNMFYAQLVNQYIYSYEDAAIQKIVDEAMKYYGWEYTWGGSNPDEGFDCSGLVQWCYAAAGIELPRTSREQWEWCEEISVEDIVPGDLLFYQNEESGGEIGHVAIYIGDGKVYEAGDPIGVYDNNDSWHQDNLLHAGRVIHFEPEEDSESSDE